MYSCGLGPVIDLPFRKSIWLNSLHSDESIIRFIGNQCHSTLFPFFAWKIGIANEFGRTVQLYQPQLEGILERQKKNPSTPSSYKLMSTCLPSKGEVYVFLRFVWLVTIAEVKLNVHQGCHMEACCLCLIPLESSVLEF